MIDFDNQWLIKNCERIVEYKNRIQFKCLDNGKLFTVFHKNLFNLENILSENWSGDVYLNSFRAPKWAIGHKNNKFIHGNISPELMEGDDFLEKEINFYLTSKFVGNFDVSSDECLKEAKELIEHIVGHYNIF